MQAPLGDAAIQSGAPIGSHPPLHVMAHRPGSGGSAVIIHAGEFAAHRMFVPAELTHYITRA